MNPTLVIIALIFSAVGIYPTRAELPILPRSALNTLAPRKADAIAEAKHAIDCVLSRRDDVAEEGRPWP